MSAEEHRKPIRLATAVYHAALADDWKAVGRALTRLTAECDSEGIASALIAWCDTFIDHASGGDSRRRQARIAAWNTDTGSLDAPDTPADARWTMRLVAARAAMDMDAFNLALAELNELPDGPPGFERGRRAAFLVESVALTVKSLPRGYGVMGRTP